MSNCLALSRISAPQDSCIKRWKFLAAGAKKHTEVYEFITFYLLPSANSAGNVKRSSIVSSFRKNFLFSSCNFLDAWLWGKEEKLEQGLQQVERAGLSGPWSYMHLNFSHPRFLI